MSHPKAVETINRVQRLNRWWSANATVEGCTFEGFYRSFNNGDVTDFDFDQGGRLYEYGDYQRMKKAMRRDIRINGERVVEVDVSGSFIFLYHTMRGVPLVPGTDPYRNCAVGSRLVAKLFVNMSLGNGAPLTRWLTEAKESYLENELGIKLAEGEKYTEEQLGWLQRDYPIGKVSKAVLAAFPLLGSQPQSGITWADLQYQESLGLIATVERLAYEFGVPALPLHDAVIVPVSYASLAEKVLKECFWKEAGVRIGVKVKG